MFSFLSRAYKSGYSRQHTFRGIVIKLLHKGRKNAITPFSFEFPLLFSPINSIFLTFWDLFLYIVPISGARSSLVFLRVSFPFVTLASLFSSCVCTLLRRQQTGLVVLRGLPDGGRDAGGRGGRGSGSVRLLGGGGGGGLEGRALLNAWEAGVGDLWAAGINK